MTEAEWMASDDPGAMLPEVTKGISPAHDFRISDRKLRLFACATLAGDSRPDYPPLATAEGFAEGRVGVAELREVWRRHCLASEAAPAYPEAAAEWARSVVSHLTALHRMTPSRAANLLRDIVGSPHRPVAMEYRYDPCPYCGAKGWHGPKADDDDTVWCRECHKPRSLGRFYCPWLTPTVVGLAHAAYDSRDEQTGHLDPVRLAVLADALEEAGCAGEECPRCRGTGELSCPKCSGEGCSPYGVGANGRCTAGDPCPGCGGTGWLPHPLLSHLRGPGPHVRGCWAIDLLTGRE